MIVNYDVERIQNTMDYFQKNFEVRWADVDPNMHLRHLALLDYTDQVRVDYFDSKGFSFLNFRKLKIGPVIFKVTASYREEIHLSETMTIHCKLDHLSDNYRKWKSPMIFSIKRMNYRVQ